MITTNFSNYVTSIKLWCDVGAKLQLQLHRTYVINFIGTVNCVCVADICYLSNVSVCLYGNRRYMYACIARCDRRVSEKFSWNFETSSFAKMHLMILKHHNEDFERSIVSVCQQITPEQPNLNEFTRNNF